MTELAVSLIFQAHSSVLDRSAPAANYKPTHPPPALHPRPANAQLNSRLEKKKRSRLDSLLSLRPDQKGGAEIDMGA